MSRMDSNIKKLWDERSEKYKRNIAGVLPKSFPIPANKYIDNWEFNLASKMIENKRGYKVLDIGCGYGRLSRRILRNFGKVNSIGIDIAKNYIDIYNHDLKPRGLAYVADMRKLPLKDGSVDVVLVVTSLMYMVNKTDQKKAFKEIFRVLKRKGRILIIERDIYGYNLITLGGLIGKIRGKKNREISATGFNPGEIIKLVRDCGGEVTKNTAIPIFTLSLPLIFGLSKISVHLLKVYLRIIALFDKVFSFLLFPSIYIAYSGYKK